MADNPAFTWDRPISPAPSVRPLPAPAGPADEPAGDGWVTLREAHERIAVPVDRIRAWARKGRVPSKLVDGPDGNPVRMVRLDETRAHAARLGAATGRTVVDLRNEGLPSVSTVPEGSLLVPLEAWDKMLAQLGHLHEAGQQLAEARERAAKAETEAAFLRERLSELRSKADTRSHPGPHPPQESPSSPPPGEPPVRHMPAWAPVESEKPEPRWRGVYRAWRSMRRR